MSRSDLSKQHFIPAAFLISMYFPPEPGGGASTAWNRALILQKLGYTVFVLCGFPSYPNGRVTGNKYKGKFFYVERTDDFTLIRLRLLPLASKGYVRRFILFINFIVLSLFWMPRILKISTRISLVYALAPVLFSSAIGLIYSRLTKSFFIYEVSDLWPEELVAFRTNFFFIIFSVGKRLAALSYSLPDMIVATSKLAAEYIIKNYRTKVLIYTLPIGVEPSKYPKKSKETSRQELIEKKILPSVLTDKFIVLYAGIISRVTRVENLAHAANKLKDEDNNIAFLIIGEGDEKEKIEEIISSNNVNNLFLFPFQDISLVPSIISAADVCIVSLPSEPIYEVTVSTKFFDYLACQKPQIGICGGELAKIINSNNIGVTVKYGEIDKLVEAILFLKNSPSLIHSMEKNSHAVLESFSLDTLASKLNDVLKMEIERKISKFKN